MNCHLFFEYFPEKTFEFFPEKTFGFFSRKDTLTFRTLFIRINMCLPHIGACTGFDRDSESGEAIRRLMRQIANLKLNANDNFELAAA